MSPELSITKTLVSGTICFCSRIFPFDGDSIVYFSHNGDSKLVFQTLFFEESLWHGQTSGKLGTTQTEPSHGTEPEDQAMKL